MSKEIYIDLEWYMNGKIFLLSYAYDLRKAGQLYGKMLTKENIEKLLTNVEFIYVYGPDVGRMENFYSLDLRKNFYCVNLLALVRKLRPHLPCYKLSTMELLYGIKRTANYKTNIFQLYSDFHDKTKRDEALRYNMEDCLNIVRLKRILCKKFSVTKKQLAGFSMI